MAVASSNELARTYETEIGGAPKAVRTWAVTLTNNTLANSPTTHAAVISHLGLDNYGAAHPEFDGLSSSIFLGMRKFTLTERFQDSPYHIQVVAEYGPVSSNELLAPTSRTSEWTFESQPSEVPALYYWDGSTRKPLVNSANDFYEGLTTLEQMVRATVRKNYADFDAANGPLAILGATNKVNASTYLGTPAHTWKCAGVNTSYITEIHNGTVYQYWQTTSELQFRQSTWNLFLPDVGWNFLDGGQKRRAMVFDFQNGEWVASPNPVALDGSGGQSSGLPFIHERRVLETANFTTLFGVPPTV